jgi:hypothetical protein
LGNSFTHFEFTTAGNANLLAADEKELAYQCVLLALQKKPDSPARCRIIPFSLGRTKPAALLLLTHFQDANPGT